MTKTEEMMALADSLERGYFGHCANAAAALREYAATMDQEPVAWLYTCQKPGTQTVYASVDENDSYHWPIDQWKSIVKTPLFAHPPAPTTPLTDEEIDTLRGMNIVRNKGALNSLAFARAVLAAQEAKSV